MALVKTDIEDDNILALLGAFSEEAKLVWEQGNIPYTSIPKLIDKYAIALTAYMKGLNQRR